MKTILLTALFSFAISLPFANSQTTFKQTAKGLPDHRIISNNLTKVSTIDSAFIMLDYSTADNSNFYPSSYQSNQGQLFNKYYTFPTDTTNSYRSTSMMFQNYDCINTITVAFDSLFATNYNMGFSPGAVNSLLLYNIYIPIIQVNHSKANDTLEVSLITVDGNGYPTSSIVIDTLFIADSANSYSIGAGNNFTINTLVWNLGYYSLGTTKFAVTVTYSDHSKLDSCWFVYGYGSVPDACPNQVTGGLFAKNTHFSKINAAKPFVANSFALWNQYYGYGIFPDPTGNNVYYPCDTSKHTFDSATDGVTYFQNINITATAALSYNTGIPTIHSPNLNISQNYPNPSNGNTVISYSLVKSAEVSFSVTDITGRVVYANTYENTSPGEHNITVNTSLLSPGVYFYTLTSPGSSLTKKMIVY